MSIRRPAPKARTICWIVGGLESPRHPAAGGYRFARQCGNDDALAERLFNRVDPDNRLVVAELERRWDAALSEVGQLRKRSLSIRRTRGLTSGVVENNRSKSLAEFAPRNEGPARRRHRRKDRTPLPVV